MWRRSRGAPREPWNKTKQNKQGIVCYYAGLDDTLLLLLLRSILLCIKFSIDVNVFSSLTTVVSVSIFHCAVLVGSGSAL